MSRKYPAEGMDSARLVQLRDRLFATGSSFATVDRSDIVGIDGLVGQIDEVANWLRNSEMFMQYNSRLEPGLLFSGEPGTGKTMLARYLATCAHALFIAVRDFPASAGSIAASITAAYVADLFARARASYAATKRPVILFWDEFELYGKRRADSSTEEASVVAQLMSELDGVNGKCPGVLFVGCTNHSNLIDPALKRHGRLGKQLEFAAPDRPGKVHLIQHYLGRHVDTSTLDLQSASYLLPLEATASTIEETCESVWSKAVANSIGQGGLPVVTQHVLNEVMLEEFLGPPPSFSNIDRKAKRYVALHELGHALVARALGVEMQAITIRPGKSTFGRVFTVGEEERGLFNARQHRNQITLTLGSLAMENYLGLVASSGIEGDVQAATTLAVSLVEKLGQHSWQSGRGWVGPVSMTALQQRASSYSETLPVSPALIEYFDREESGVLRECYNRAYGILAPIRKEAIEALADGLMEAETWLGQQFEEACARVLDGKVAVRRADT